MKNLIFTLLCIGIGSFISCTNQTKEGAPETQATEMEDYTLVDMGNAQFASKSGPESQYGEQGKLLNGKKEGFWITFHDRVPVRIASATMYVQGKKNGPSYTFATNGTMESYTEYRNDIFHGDYEKYKSGKLLEKGSMKNGELDGKRIIYYQNFEDRGKVQQTMEYKNGELDGTMLWFDLNGKVVEQFTYRNGKKVE